MTPLVVVRQGTGDVKRSGPAWDLIISPSETPNYSNAMIASYRNRRDFSFAAGSRLELTACAEKEISGTAGFGFWNHPYGSGIRPPRALWFFFASHPSDMPLAMNVPGTGFKCAVFDAGNLAFYCLLPFAPVGALLMRIPLLYRMLWPLGQRAIGVDEYRLDTEILKTPRRYGIAWHANEVAFEIDQRVVYRTRRVPRGRLGFVAWIDNQFAVVRPQGTLRFGLTGASHTQQLSIADIVLTSLTRP